MDLHTSQRDKVCLREWGVETEVVVMDYLVPFKGAFASFSEDGFAPLEIIMTFIVTFATN